MIKVLMPIADGSEEMEAVISIDLFRRAKWEVVSAGLKAGPITASRGVKLLPDVAWDQLSDISAFDALVIPGGGRGVENMIEDSRVLEAVRTFHKNRKMIAAICAGPLVLQAAGILDGRRVTSHPGEAKKITKAKRLDEAVVIDGNLVTSQGAGTSFKFALTIIAALDGWEKADLIAREIVLSL